MSNILDYVKEYGNKSFFEIEFNEVDAAILSLLTYLDLNNIVSNKSHTSHLGNVLEYFLNYYDIKSYQKRGFIQKDIIKLCKALKNKIRYQDILLYNYIYKIDFDEQFSAITMKLPTNKVIIAYEGTDHNLVGWEEDFAMCYKFPVSAEKDAIKYINKSISILDKDVTVIGHSKGGHLAMIASMYSNPIVKLKIKSIYNFDGPGLRQKEISSSKYKSIIKKLNHIVPNYSVVGLLLRHNEEFKTIKSTRKDLFAHSIFTWEIDKSSFKITTLSKLSKNLDKSIVIWLDQHTDIEREKIVKDIFSYLRKQNISNIKDITKIKNVLLLIKNRNEFDIETKNLISNFIKFNFDFYINN